MEEAQIRFGTDGWRAILADGFTFANVRRVSQALAGYLQEAGLAARGVAVAHDARFLGERLAAEVAAVLAGNGIPTYLAPVDLPTPVVAFGVVQQGLAGAVMLTASHNPPEYHGLKFIPEYGGPAEPAVTTAIEAHIGRVLQGQVPVQRRDVAEAQAAGLVRPFRPEEAYERHLRSLVDWAAIGRARLRVAYDGMHGSGRTFVGRLLRQAGAEVVELRVNRDPSFGGVPPEPIEANLQPLIEAVRSGGLQLGLATDGDADRFGVVDEDGTYLSANQVIALLVGHLIEHRGWRRPVVRTVATTHLVDRLAARYGLPVYETPVGFKYVGAYMRREPILLGGEESGGLSIGGHIPEKDGILADLLIAEARAMWEQPLGRVLQRLMAEVGPCVSRRLDLHVRSEVKAAILRRLREAAPARLAGRAVTGRVDVDGVKLLLEGDCWLLVRPSGTEDLVRVYLEAPDPASLSELQEAVQGLVDVA